MFPLWCNQWCRMMSGCLVSSVFLSFRMVLKGIQKSLLNELWCVLFFFWMVLKGVIFTENNVQFIDGLEMSLKYTMYVWSWKEQFSEEWLPWRMEHYIIQSDGLERSQFCAAYGWMVLKWVNYCHMGESLERSQFAPISKIPPKWSWKESTFAIWVMVLK